MPPGASVSPSPRRSPPKGVSVGIVGRDADALEAAANRISGDAAVFAADTGDDAAVAAMAAQAREALGGVDILVNCAAPPFTPPGFTDEDLLPQFNVKVAGYLRCARAFAPEMADRGWGRIINVAGLAARTADSLVGAVRNVAVAAMTKNLADEYGPDGVNVTVVHPGPTFTKRFADGTAAFARSQGSAPEAFWEHMSGQISIGRIVTPDEVADVICFLASPRSVAITGDAICVGGGARGSVHY